MKIFIGKSLCFTAFLALAAAARGQQSFSIQIIAGNDSTCLLYASAGVMLTASSLCKSSMPRI